MARLYRAFSIDVHQEGGWMRLIVLGDLHGCFEEMNELIGRVAPRQEDVVACVGDFLTKGPQPEACVGMWRDKGWHAVLGNSDEAVLQSRRGEVVRSSTPDEDTRRLVVPDDILEYLESLPLVLDYPALDCAVVHGGILPHSSFSDGLDPNGLLTLREVVEDGESWRSVSEGDEASSRFWADVWNGDRFVVYGHTPRRKVARHKRAMGIDTGCVYGWSLTAAVRSDDGTWTTQSVPARRAWAER